MVKVNPNRLLTAQALYFKDDKEPLQNCCIYLVDHFAIVGTHENDNEPTWYNVDLIDRIENVKPYEEPVPAKDPYKTRIENIWSL